MVAMLGVGGGRSSRKATRPTFPCAVGAGEGRALQARHRPGAACGRAADPPHRQLSLAHRDDRARQPRLHGPGDEPALGQQRISGRASSRTRSTSSRASSSCASGPASPGSSSSATAAAGPAMSFYQAVSEKGVGLLSGRQQAGRVRARVTRRGCRRRTGSVLVDAHPGVSVNGLRSLNAGAVSR